MKKFLLCFLCLFTIISCVSDPNKFTDLEKQQALANGKAIINIEWNYHGKQLYTIWFKKADLEKDFTPFYWFTGNNKIPQTGMTNSTNSYLLVSASNKNVRSFIVEPGEYVLWGIKNQAQRPISKAGKDWYSFIDTIGKNSKDIKEKLKNGDFFAKFIVKSGEEITLEKVDLIYDNLNYIDSNSSDKNKKTINVIKNSGKEYTFGNKFNIIMIETEN